MENNIDYVALGLRIRQQRETAGLTQEQLGEACNLSASFMGHIERGTRKLSVESLFKIAVTLDVSIDYLLFGNAIPKSSLPTDIFALLEGSDSAKQQNFWRTVKTLASHINDL